MVRNKLSVVTALVFGANALLCYFDRVTIAGYCWPLWLAGALLMLRDAAAPGGTIGYRKISALPGS